jgi:hypothetical protein
MSSGLAVPDPDVNDGIITNLGLGSSRPMIRLRRDGSTEEITCLFGGHTADSEQGRLKLIYAWNAAETRVLSGHNTNNAHPPVIYEWSDLCPVEE